MPPAQAASIADLKWFDVFKDEKLQELIRTALERNYDLRDAVARVEAARANLGITRSNQFPNFGASGASKSIVSRAMERRRYPRQLLPSQNRNFGTAALELLSFEIDIWGRLRRATEAARANLLSAEENRKAVVTTLVSDVATAYLTLRELDYTLEISKRTLQTREESLTLTRSRQSGGVSTLLDLRQAEQLVYTAAETIPGIQQQIEQTENQITLLLGENPGSVPRGRSLTRTGFSSGGSGRPAVGFARTPSRHSGRGAGSDRRQRRDRRGARSLLSAVESQRSAGRREHATIQPVQRTAQHVESGAAGDAADLHGRTDQVNVKFAQAERDRTLVQYEKTIQTAFTEVSDALIAHQRVRESREKQEALVLPWRTGCAWPTCAIAVVWIRSSTLWTPIAICFRRSWTWPGSGWTKL